MVSKIELLKREYINRLACFLVLILLSCGTASALSNDGGGTWDYSREILVQENSSDALKDHSILIQLNEGNFPAEAQEDGADIRFTDEDNNELKYWIEKFDPSTEKAKIWVKIPYTPTSIQTKIKMYYGNPEADPVSASRLLRYPDVSGSWTGTLYQFDDGETFLFDLDLSQDGSKISGTSKINGLDPRDEYYAIMEISGSVNDRVLSFKELRSLEEYSPGFVFFLKNVDLNFEDKFPSKLEGLWECYWNSNKYGGTISLRRDVSEPVTNITILEPQILYVVTTKTVSPQSIRQFQESTITIKIENTGRSEITDIEVVDSAIPSSFELVHGNLPCPRKFDIIEPHDTEEVQYTIRPKESGTFSLNPCTVTFADKELNIQEIKSKPISLKVLPSITEQGEKLEYSNNTYKLFDNFSVLAWMSTEKNSLIKYIIILGSAVICYIIIKKALKPSTREKPSIKQKSLIRDVVATISQNPLVSTIIGGLIVSIIMFLIEKSSKL